MIQDTYLTYQFLKRLTTPFDKWPAYKAGVINAKGDIIKTVKDRTKDEKKTLGRFDLLVLRLKKIMAKVPGGSSKIASYAAALWLVKEQNDYNGYRPDSEILSEVTSLKEELDINILFNLMVEDGIVNAAGAGNIDGIGIGPKGEPGITPAKMSKYKKANKKQEYRVAKGIM